MNHAAKLVTLLLTVCLMSCRGPCGCEPGPPPNRTAVQLHYIDSAGKSLFNGKDFKTADIALFIKKGETFERYEDKLMDHPQFFDTYIKDQDTVINIWPSFYNPDKYCDILVELKPGVTDSLRIEYEMSSGEKVFKKARVNGKESSEAFITVIK